MNSILLKSALLVSLLLNASLLYIVLNNASSPEPTDNISASQEGQTIPAPQTYESGQSYPFMRIVDGDTIVVGFNNATEYVRFVGIDSPEPNDPGGPQCYAEESTRHLQELMQTGVVILHFDESQGMRDSYGRLLAYVELPDGTDLGEQMVADGYAREYTYAAEYARQNAYKTAENLAIEEERGLWNQDSCK